MAGIPFLSVCSGIGAPEVAFGRSGMHAVLCSEIEAFPRAVLAHRFDARDARRAPHPDPLPAGERERKGPALWGDFTALRPRHLRRLGIALPRVLVGGTPCQSFSIAGRRGSLSDPRGNLSLAFTRLAHALAAALAGAERTAYDDAPVFHAVWENVPGCLSTPDNAFGCVLAALVGGDAPLVPPGAKWGPRPCFDARSHDVMRTYGWQSCRWPGEGMAEGPRARAAWRILDAQHFAVPQRRARVILVVGFGAGADPAEVLFELVGVRGDSAACGSAEEDPAGTLGEGARGRGGWSHDDMPIVGEAYGGGNTSGPVDVAACLTAKGQRIDFEVETFVAHTLRGEGFDASEDGTGRGIPLVVGSLDDSAGGADENDAEQGRLVPFAFDTTQITSPECRSKPVPDGQCHTLSAHQHPPAIAFNARQDPDVSGDIAAPLDTDGYSQAIVFSSKDHGADAGEIAPTLRAMGHSSSHPNAGGQVAVASMQSGVRRLTPRECERLQSFPDDHTLIPWRGRPESDCPDGPRYRAIGNSMNVEMMAWLGARLAASIRRADA